jgi:formamidopyrimidine-DNA glycosylase
MRRPASISAAREKTWGANSRISASKRWAVWLIVQLYGAQVAVLFQHLRMKWRL